MGYIYIGEINASFRQTKSYIKSLYYSNLTWPSAIMDGLTIISYIAGSLLLLNTLHGSTV